MMNLNSYVVLTAHDQPTTYFLFIVCKEFCVVINRAYLMVKVLNYEFFVSIQRTVLPTLKSTHIVFPL